MNKLVEKIQGKKFPVLFGIEDLEKLKFSPTEISVMFKEAVEKNG